MKKTFTSNEFSGTCSTLQKYIFCSETYLMVIYFDTEKPTVVNNNTIVVAMKPIADTINGILPHPLWPFITRKTTLLIYLHSHVCNEN